MLKGKDLKIKSGDIVFTRGKGILSKGIRWASRSIGEKRTVANHIGQIVRDGNLATALIAEARAHFLVHALSVYYDRDDQVAIFRPLNVPQQDLDRISIEAISHKGESYGYLKIGLHLIDKLFNGAYVARRLGGVDRWPICSYRVARSWATCGYDFGVNPKEAQPDDIWDFIQAHKDKYDCVHTMARLGGGIVQ